MKDIFEAFHINRHAWHYFGIICFEDKPGLFLGLGMEEAGMKPHMLETNLAQVLELAGIEPADASDWQITMADRMLQLNTTGHGVVNLRSAALALRRHLEAQR